MELHPAHVNLYMTPDIRDLGILSLKLKQEESLLELLKMILSLEKGTRSRNLRMRLFLVLNDVVPRNGITIVKSFFGTMVIGVRCS